MRAQSSTTASTTPTFAPNNTPVRSKALPEARKNEVVATPRQPDGFESSKARPLTLSPALAGPAKPTTPSTPSTPAAGKLSPKDIPAADWTCFVHLNADNNLEEFGKADLNEMERVGSITGKLNMIALVDGGALNDKDGWKSNTRLMYVTKDPSNTGKITSQEIDVDPNSDLGKLLAKGKGELNTGSPEVLRAAVDYVQRNVESKHFMVDLWDHGAGWRGVSYDDHPADSLDMADIKQALSNLPKKIDIISSDSCLMATKEVADTAKAAGADWLVGSEEVEPGTGWDYGDLLSRASNAFADGEVTPEKMAKLIQESYAAGPSDNVTMSVTDLSKLGALNAKLDSFSDALLKAGGLQDKTLRAAYQKTLRFDDADQMDLGDFARRVSSGTQDASLQKASAVLLKALADSTNEMAASKGHAKYGASTGLTIYGPKGAVDREYKKAGNDWLTSRWNDVIATYSGKPRVA